MHAFLSLTSKDDLGPVHTYLYSFGKATFFSPSSKKFASTRSVFAGRISHRFRPSTSTSEFCLRHCLHFFSLAYNLTHRSRGRKYVSK